MKYEQLNQTAKPSSNCTTSSEDGNNAAILQLYQANKNLCNEYWNQRRKRKKKYLLPSIKPLTESSKWEIWEFPPWSHRWPDIFHPRKFLKAWTKRKIYKICIKDWSEGKTPCLGHDHTAHQPASSPTKGNGTGNTGGRLWRGGGAAEHPQDKRGWAPSRSFVWDKPIHTTTSKTFELTIRWQSVRSQVKWLPHSPLKWWQELWRGCLEFLSKTGG